MTMIDDLKNNVIIINDPNPYTLYAFLYNPMIHESGYITVSIHRTRKGAEIALEQHKKAGIEEDIEDCGIHDDDWDVFKNWKIEEIQILD